MEGGRLGWREVCNLRFHGGGSDERVKVAGPMQGSIQLLFVGCVTIRLFILRARSQNAQQEIGINSAIAKQCQTQHNLPTTL